MADDVPFASPVVPPPLPASAPRPVIPLDPVAVPPPLPAGYGPPEVPGPQAAGPYYKPPVFFETPSSPRPGGEPQWVLWGFGGVIVLMIGLGAGFFVSVRNGPSAAVARGRPAPTWKPVTTPAVLPPAPALPARPAPAVTTPRVAPARPQPVAPNSPYAAKPLPSERQADQQLKQMWQIAETAGLTTRTIRTMKAIRQPGLSVQPIKSDFTGAVPQAVLLLQNIHTSMPAAVLESFEVTDASAAAPGSPAPSGKVSVAMTSNFYLLDHEGGSAPLCPPPDVAGALAKVSKQAGDRFQFTRVTVKVDGATNATTAALRASVRLEALAQSDVDVAALMHGLTRAEGLEQVRLDLAETTNVAGQDVRRFVIEFRVDNAKSNDAAPAPLSPAALGDPFRAPAWFNPAGAPHRKAITPAAAPPPLNPADAARAVQQLELESIVNGKSPACVINGRLYRTGNQVNGLTIQKINPDGVVLRHGDKQFELKLK